MAETTPVLSIDEQLEKNRQRAADVKRLQNPGDLVVKPLSAQEEYEFSKAAHKDNPNVTVAQGSRGPVVFRRDPLAGVEPINLNATQFGLPRQQPGFGGPRPAPGQVIKTVYETGSDGKLVATQTTTVDLKAHAAQTNSGPLIGINPELEKRQLNIPTMGTPAPQSAPAINPDFEKRRLNIPAMGAGEQQPAPKINSNVRLDLPALNPNGTPAISAPTLDNKVRYNIPVPQIPGAAPAAPSATFVPDAANNVRLNIPIMRDAGAPPPAPAPPPVITPRAPAAPSVPFAQDPANNVRLNIPIMRDGAPPPAPTPGNPANNVRLNLPALNADGTPVTPKPNANVRVNIPVPKEFQAHAPAPTPNLGSQARVMKVPSAAELEQMAQNAKSAKPSISGVGAVNKVGGLGTVAHAGVQAAQGDYSGAAKTVVTGTVTSKATQKGVEIGTEAAVKGLQAAANVAEKKGLQVASNLLRTGGTKLPVGIGLAIAAGFAAYDYYQANNLEKQAQAKGVTEEQKKQLLDEASSKKRSAGLTLAGGAAAVVPVVGTAVAVGINVVNVGLDVKDGLKASEQPSKNAQRIANGTHGMNPTKPETVTAKTQVQSQTQDNQRAA